MMKDEETILNRVKKLIEEGKTEDAVMLIQERTKNEQKPINGLKYFYYLAEIQEQEKNLDSALNKLEESKNQIDLLTSENYSFSLQDMIICTNCYIKLTKHYLRKNQIKNSSQCLSLANKFYEKIDDNDKPLLEKNEIDSLFMQISDKEKQIGVQNKENEERKNQIMISQCIEEGNTLKKQEKFNEAIEKFSMALNLREDENTLYLRSLCYLSVEKYLLSINDLNKILNKEEIPLAIKNMSNLKLSECYIKMGYFNKAFKLLVGLVKILSHSSFHPSSKSTLKPAVQSNISDKNENNFFLKNVLSLIRDCKAKIIIQKQLFKETPKQISDKMKADLIKERNEFDLLLKKLVIEPDKNYFLVSAKWLKKYYDLTSKLSKLGCKDNTILYFDEYKEDFRDSIENEILHHENENQKGNSQIENQFNKPILFPGPVTNFELIKFENNSEFHLNENIQDEEDFKILSEEAWKLIKNRFNGFDIVRSSLLFNNQAIVDVNEINLNLIIYPLLLHNDNKPYPFKVSRYLNEIQLFDKLKEILFHFLNKLDIETNNLDNVNIFLWKTKEKFKLQSFFNEFRKQKFNDKKILIDAQKVTIETNLHESFLLNNDTLIVEFSCQDYSSFKSISENLESQDVSNVKEHSEQIQTLKPGVELENKNTKGVPILKEEQVQKLLTDTNMSGVTGLKNLGNTCYMNSGIQCISNCIDLTKYFLSNIYLQEINKTNNLGYGGKLAIEFGELIKRLWLGKSKYTEAAFLKKVLGKKNTNIAGYGQQDSQELINYILDGLNEDLNRVQKKEYKEEDSFSKEKDEIKSKITWEYFLKRTNSIITDLFFGQLKSRLVCPKCRDISTKFEQFLMLSVPILKFIEVDLVFVPLKWNENSKRVKLVITDGLRMNDLELKLKTLLKLDPSNSVYFASLDKGITHISYDQHEACVGTKQKEGLMFAFEYKTTQGSESNENIYFLELVLFSYNENTAARTKYPYTFYLPLQRKDLLTDIKKSIFSKLNELNNFYENNQTNGNEKNENSNSNKELTENVELDHSSRYSIHIFNNMTSSFYSKKDPLCEFCNKSHKHDCSFDFDNESNKTLQDLIKMPKKSKRKLVLSIRIKDTKASQKIFEFMNGYKQRKETFNSPSRKLDQITLNDCLEAFCREEQLDENNKWFCPNCKDHVQVYKQMSIYRLPKILIIHLKRFSKSTDGHFIWTNKDNSFVNYPLNNLDMSQFIVNIENQNNNYDLFAISNHMGGLRGGHYTATCFNPITQKWYEFDDTKVFKEKSNNIVASEGYVLFYRLSENKNNTK